MSLFLRFASQYRGLRCQEVSSQELIVSFIADRRSQDRILSFNHCALLMRRCDMLRRISGVGDSLGFLLRTLSKYAMR